MSKARKASTANGNDPRQKLTGDFVTALQADWQMHGQEIIEALRTQSPVKYAEIVSRLAVPEAAPAPDDFSQCQSSIGHWQEAIGASWRARRRNDRTR